METGSYLTAVDRTDDRFMTATTYYPDGDTTEAGYVMYQIFDEDMNPLSNIQITMAQGQDLMEAVLGSDGNIYAVYYEEGAMDGTWYMMESYMQDGTCLWSFPLQISTVQEEDYQFMSMQAGLNGEIFVLSNKSIEVYMTDGREIDIPLGDLAADSLYITQYGDLLVDCYDGESLYMCYVDVDNAEIDPTVYELPFDLFNYESGNSMISDMILVDDAGIYSYNLGDADMTPVMGFYDSGIEETDLWFYDGRGIFFDDEDSFYSIYKNSDSELIRYEGAYFMRYTE